MTRRAAMPKPLRIERRRFNAMCALAPFVRISRPIDRARVAVIGAWNRGRENLAGVLDAGAEVAVLCDVDARHLASASSLAAARGIERVRTERDWRRVLDAPKGLDGVVVSTPDHSHAPISAAALQLGLGVYCEKPLAHTVEETRSLAKLARESRRATQMGIQIHAGANYRRVVEAIRGGAIGDVREVHVLCSKSWSDGRFGAAVPAPEHLDFDLWLGPAEERPYCEGLHPTWWRKYWAFGTGTVGDMACHWLDLVHWALELERPESVECEGPPVHADGAPAWLHATWVHAKREGRRAVTVHWWDGGKKPDVARAGLDDCHVWIGERGKLYSTYSTHEVVLDDPRAEWTAPPESLPPSPGQHAEWVGALEGRGACLSHFGYAAPLTEAVLLATVAYRSGAPVRVDPKDGKVSGAAGVEGFLAKSYRRGFALPT